MSLMRPALLWCSENRWMRRNIPNLWFVRRAVKRFMPGETAAEALTEARALNGRSMGAILTQLGENVADSEAAEAIVEHYLGVLDAISKSGLDAVVSVKLTQLGLDLDPELAYGNLERIVRSAREKHSVIWVDMEQNGYVDDTLALVHRIRDRYESIGVCLQAYLYRTTDDLERLVERKIGIRLVKGAYAEPADVAFPVKADVDANYFALAERLLEVENPGGQLRPAFATHDMALIDRIRRSAVARGVASQAYQIQMLYGIERGAQQRLTADDLRVMVLISYGEAWYPWYVRRLAERPANVWFVVKSTFS